MRVEIVRATVVGGRVAEPGQVVEVSDHIAMFLLNAGRARPARSKRERATREKREKAVKE